MNPQLESRPNCNSSSYYPPLSHIAQAEEALHNDHHSSTCKPGTHYSLIGSDFDKIDILGNLHHGYGDVYTC
jgi:hypothetical protein